MKKRMLTMYRKICKVCGKEMLNSNKKVELCWRCREELRKKVRRSEK